MGCNHYLYHKLCSALIKYKARSFIYTSVPYTPPYLFSDFKNHCFHSYHNGADIYWFFLKIVCHTDRYRLCCMFFLYQILNHPIRFQKDLSLIIKDSLTDKIFRWLTLCSVWLPWCSTQRELMFIIEKISWTLMALLL